MTKPEQPKLLYAPDAERVSQSNLTALMVTMGIDSLEELYSWSVDHPEEYWAEAIRRLGISFTTPPTCTLPSGYDPLDPDWLPEATLNIADCCLSSSEQAAIVEHTDSGLRWVAHHELKREAHQVAAGLRQRGMLPGTSVGVFLPMDARSVAIYLGIILAGCTVVSIADSFSAEALATRLRIADTRLVFTVDGVQRGNRWHAIYERLTACDGPSAVVSYNRSDGQTELRTGDVAWSDFIATSDDCSCESYPADHPTNVLFSSGTTGDPKAIVWDQTPPIKAAADGHFHHDIQPEDVVAWHTSLGWMMGPWLIYATLLNGGTIALYDGAPTERGFPEFVREAGVTVLGVVPALVRRWRETGVAEGVDLSNVKTLSSTGECSAPDDMVWLSELVGGAPVIEYCGGTEIGGGYLTSTVIQNNYASIFSTPALGSRIVVPGDNGKEAEVGEVYLIPPAMGLSRKLLNQENDEVYHSDLPPWPTSLRRHGDLLQKTAQGLRVLGRADDTMNLGGIKVGSAEIERVLLDTPGVRELAAIEVPTEVTGGGPSSLVICVATEESAEVSELKRDMQQRLSKRLNPLFRIASVQLMSALPRTSSNKIMRRVLRQTVRDAT